MYPYLRFFTRTNEFIDEAVSRRGTVVVNCVMGWSRSATVVAAYLMSKKARWFDQPHFQTRRYSDCIEYKSIWVKVTNGKLPKSTMMGHPVCTGLSINPSCRG